MNRKESELANFFSKFIFKISSFLGDPLTWPTSVGMRHFFILSSQCSYFIFSHYYHPLHLQLRISKLYLAGYGNITTGTDNWTGQTTNKQIILFHIIYWPMWPIYQLIARYQSRNSSSELTNNDSNEKL